MKILVAIYSPFASWCIPDAEVDRLRRWFPEHRFERADDDDEALHGIGDAEIVYGSVLTPEQVAAARALRWVHSPAAGVGNMLFPAMVDSPIVMTNSRGNSSATIAEHVIAVTLALLRDLPLAWRRQAERVWAQDEFNAGANMVTLGGRRVLVVGLGSIGGATATLAAAFGAHVVGIRRRPDGAAPDGVAAVRPPAALAEELRLADVVVIAAPHTRETSHLIGARELASMKDNAILVNVSRGKLIDEAALVAELAKGRLRAGLDVFEHEPLAPASPLWSSSRVLMTPHVSGFHADYWTSATAIFADNLRRFVAGEPLANLVDKKAGY